MMKKYGYIIFAAIVLSLFLTGQGAVAAKLQLAGSIADFFDVLTPDSELRERISMLEKENEDLRAQILNARISNPKEIKVYSSYPFNNASELAIAAGKNQGMNEKSVIVHGKTLLVGKVKKIFDDYSIITTVHDSGWQMAVRIGEKEIDGLLAGGIKLTVDLISPKSQVNAGDIVITAGAGLPYGLAIGRIKEVTEDPATHFKKAVVEPSLQLHDLRNVSIYSK